MKDTTEILAKLRRLMQQPPATPLGHNDTVSAYIVPSNDAHQSEYICEFDMRRAFITGFDGSAGTAVVTTDKALLWTDGRYYQQAAKQIDANWTLMKDGLPTTPSIGRWLAKNLPSGSVVGVDPKLLSYQMWEPIQKDLNVNECLLVPVEKNLVDMVWGENQPKRSSNEILALDLKFAGMRIDEKWDTVKKQMVEKKGPQKLQHGAVFIGSEKLPNNFKDHLLRNKIKISIYCYEEIGTIVATLARETNEKIWIAASSSYYLTALIPKNKLHQEITPIAIMKAVKNQTEVEGFINSHIRDGVALCQYFAWLEKAVENNVYVDEISGATKLEEFRSKKEYYKGLSFRTISSSGPNSSIIHYHPSKETNRQINDKEVYLCDSGAQYLDGTTDVTRTMHFGEPIEFQKETYTRVVKGQLSLGAAIFPRKVMGRVLDSLARKSLWDIGLDYGHGTGHGVGHFLNVHEGPMSISMRLMPDDPGLQEDMFMSNEPGFYQDGEFGMRVEDIVQIVQANSQYNFAGRGALTFKTITMCPKQTKMIKKELLTDKELKLLNDYHQIVWQTLSPILERENDAITLTWLRKETQVL